MVFVANPFAPYLPCSARSPASDVVLSFVTSYLGTHPRASSQSAAAALAPEGTNAASSSRGIELHTDARLWEVQWPELTILRLIGHGSFGSVYLAEWNQILVAVKVLVGKGERRFARDAAALL